MSLEHLFSASTSTAEATVANSLVGLHGFADGCEGGLRDLLTHMEAVHRGRSKGEAQRRRYRGRGRGG